jgi:serine/threonine-protein kinase
LAGHRFHILRPHAKGGLGQVSVALDEELHREVALKEMQDRYADDSVGRSRFLLEAEITGGLEHPGIVPVYSLGHYPDGRPFYAMRFVRGNSLKAAIESFHKTETADPKRGERALALRQLLGRFVDVCNTIAYAHSRGVLHRDLKPANIMLGPFGETLVVDWGLAKVVGRPEGATGMEEGTLQLTQVIGSAPTQMGSAIGTPQYMSPEQAAGRLDLLGPASDVYSLGATLYCLLTGKAPVADLETAKVLRKVQLGQFPTPRQVRSSVPVALQAICLKAMAIKPEDRYRSPRALADDIEHWLADEPVTAWHDPLQVRLRRWARRHKAVVSSMAALLLMGVVAMAVGLAAVAAEQERTAAERDQARANLKLANANFQLAKRAVDECFHVVKDDPLLQQEKMRTVRRLLLRKALPFYEGFRLQRQQDQEIQADLASNYFRLAFITDEIGRNPEALKYYQQARAVQERLIKDYPRVASYQSDLALTYNKLGNLEREAGHRATALDYYEEARAIREQLVKDHPEISSYQNDLASSFNNLGVLQHDRGRKTAALSHFERARAIRVKLAKDHPQVAAYQSSLALTYNNLGSLQRDCGRSAAAQKSYERALLIRKKLSKIHPKVVAYQNAMALTCHSLGKLHHYRGNRATALAYYEQARIIREQLVKDHPEVPAYQNALAFTYHDLGFLFRTNGWRDKATNAFHKDLSIRQKLVRDFPGVTEYQNGLAWFLAACPEPQFRDPARAVALGRKAVKRAPQTPKYWNTLGVAYYRAGNWKAALGAMEKSIRNRSGGICADWFFLAMAHCRLRDKVEARNWYDRAVRWMEKNQPHNDELRSFRSEAATLLDVPIENPATHK